MPDFIAQFLGIPGLGWLVAATCVAGLVRGFAGFGSAMIIMPVASTVLSPVAAVTFLITSDLIGPIPSIRGALRVAHKPDLVRLGIGAALAVPVGVLVLSSVSPVFFGWLVSGIVFVLLTILMLGWRYRGALTPRLVLGTGALGGVLSGAVGLAGPPVIMLYMASTLPAQIIRANLTLYLVLIDIIMIAVIASYGLLQWEPTVAGVILSVPYMLCNKIGASLFAVGSERQFRYVAYGIIATSAVIGLPVWQ